MPLSNLIGFTVKPSPSLYPIGLFPSIFSFVVNVLSGKPRLLLITEPSYLDSSRGV